MSGWVVLTFDPVTSEDWMLQFAPEDTQYINQTTELSDEYEHIDIALCRELIKYTSIDAVGIDGKEIYAHWSYTGDVDCETILQETARMWDRAVVLRANDTGNEGTATLYEQETGEIAMADEYKEHQCACCGGRTGRIAAAYMLLEYHIDAAADFYSTPYTVFTSEDELNHHEK